MSNVRVIVIKPSKYGIDGIVERFWRGFMANGTITHIRSILNQIDPSLEVQIVDEYVQTDLKYLDLLRKGPSPTLLLLVGVQSHQFHRGLDLAAFALSRGVEHVIIGGPHVMTCDTSALQGFGLSFALS